MELSSDDIRHLAHLSRLELKDDEIERFRKQLTSIFQYVEQLRSIPTNDVEPTGYGIATKDVLREDAPEASTTDDVIIGQFPDRAEREVKVKAVFDE